MYIGLGSTRPDKTWGVIPHLSLNNAGSPVCFAYQKRGPGYQIYLKMLPKYAAKCLRTMCD